MALTALVTGGSRGIGAAVSRRLAKDGFRVAANYCCNEEAAQGLLVQLRQISALEHQIIRADVSVRAEAEELFRRAGPVDVLVNNAGIAQQKLFTDLTEADWDRMFDVDVKSVFHCCQLALPHMLHEKAGCILNLSSMWGQTGASCEVHYSAAKAAVIGLTKALAKELGPSHIRVNCIAPGVISTEMNGNLDEETLAALREETPLEEIGTPEDIAAAAAFLVSPAAGFITGQVLGVNGGFVI